MNKPGSSQYLLTVFTCRFLTSSFLKQFTHYSHIQPHTYILPSMATSVTTTKKKKLVYKQDNDGVFRLKKVDNNDISSIEYAEDKKKVDDYINELLDCSYKLPEEPKPEVEPPKSQAPEKKRIKQKVSKPTSPKTSSKPFPPTSFSSTYTPAAIPTNSSTFLDRMKSAVGNQSVKHFHIQSFVLGAVSTLVLYRSQDLLLHYAIVIFNVLKVLVVVSVVIGCATWYSGIVTLLDLGNSGKIIDQIKARINGTDSTPKQQDNQQEHDDQELHYTEHYYESDDDDSESLPKSKSPSIHSLEDPLAPPSRERKHSSIRVTPFRMSPRPLHSESPHSHQQQHLPQSRHRFQSAPDLASNKPPQLYRLNTADAKMSHYRKQTSPVRSRKDLVDSFSSRVSPNKHLPPAPVDEDLPFINEVKLVDSLDEEVFKPDLVDHNDFVKRLVSTVSKKSVLGTRANYNKFLASVLDNDLDFD